MPLADLKTKLAKTANDEWAIFRLFTNGVKTNRDDWVYDFDPANLRAKTSFFVDTYNQELGFSDKSYNPAIKWSSALRDRFDRGEQLVHDGANSLQSLYRPFTMKHHYADIKLNDRLTRNHYEMFGQDLKQANKAICLSGVASSKPFQVLATSGLFGFDMLEKTQCLPLYRYTEDGDRVCNITDWGIRHITEHYRDDWGKDFQEIYPNGISAEEIFAYTYAVLHDPVYRYDYANDLLREFPRLPLYRDFDLWAKMGQELLDLHISFESAEPYPLERHDKAPPAKVKDERWTPKPRLHADKERGIITLDEQTSLSGMPADAWRYVLGSRSALEWVLDQYKEKKPRDPTIREKFNNYRFADHKERVIDLLQRVCTVSVKTMEIVDGMAYWDGDKLVVFGDRDRDELAMLAWSQFNSEPEDEEWLASWSKT